MSYLTTIEQQVREIVKNTPHDQLADTLVSVVKATVLESYKNGLHVGKGNRQPRTRQNPQS